MKSLLFYFGLLVVIGLIGATAIIGDDVPREGLQRSQTEEAEPLQALTVSDPETVDEDLRDRDPLDQGADNCPATVIPGIPYTDTGTTAGRANNWNTAASCAGGGGGSNAPDVIYSFTPGVNQSVIISTCGSLFNTLLEVRTGGACPGSSQSACADAGCGGDAELRINLNAGTMYYIIVDGWETQAGSYTLHVDAMCNVFSHADDLVECAETVDSSHARLDCNGGPCNVMFGGVASYTNIACGQTYFAKAFTYVRAGLPYMDTDWYRFSLSEACTVKITIEAEFPWVLSGGTALASCADHPNPVGGYTCDDPYTLLAPLGAGEYEFTVRPWDGAGIPAARDYRVTLDCIPMSGCVIDGALTAPGSISGNTCGAGDDCDLRESPDQTFWLIIPETDSWTIGLCESGAEDWSSWIYVTEVCCDNMLGLEQAGCRRLGGWPRINCLALAAGTYAVTIEGSSADACGAFVLTAERCRFRCCYGTDYEQCTNTTDELCDALGGFWDPYRSCDANPCTYIPPCTPGAAISQPPYGFDYSEAIGWPSDLYEEWVMFDQIEGLTGSVTTLRFWGTQNLGFWQSCHEDPMPFSIRFHADSTYGPGSVQVMSFDAILDGTPEPDLWNGEDTLYRYEVTLPEPLTTDNVWLSVVGEGDPDCYFRWATSAMGDGYSFIWYDNGDRSLASGGLAFCLGGCPPADSVVLKFNSGISFTLSFWAPIDAEYRLYFTTQTNNEYPTGFVLASHPELTAGRHEYTFNAGSLYQRWVVVTNCE